MNIGPVKNIGILGMGALGLLYGSRIDNAVYIMDKERKEKYEGKEFSVNGNSFLPRMVSTEEAFPVDLLIVAVKYPALAEALETAEPFVNESTTIISVMNGISTEKIIGEKFGKERVVYCVAQGMDAMKLGNGLKYTRYGTLFTGRTAECGEDHFARLAEFLEKSGIPYKIEDDIIARMWFKFMLNVGINQTCMAYGVPYGIATKPGEEYNMMVAAMKEVIALAGKEGITLTEKQLYQCIEIEKTLDPQATPSMGQDRINRKKSEVELFAGTVIRLSEKYGLPCPANRFYYDKILAIEAEYTE